MRNILFILILAEVLSACGNSANTTNQKIKSTFGSDIYTYPSTIQAFVTGFMLAFGDVKYPADWNKKLKLDQNYKIIPLHNNSANKTSECLVKLPLKGTIFVEACL